jgi:Na+/glutamate symporter
VVSRLGLNVYIAEMLRKTFIAVASACLAFIVYATLCPIHDRPHFWGLHEPHRVATLERLTAFLAFGFAARFAMPRSRSVLVVLATAIGLEVLQNIVPHRDPRIIDAAVKIVGGMTGIILAHFLIKWWQIRPTDRSTRAGHETPQPPSGVTSENEAFEAASLVPADINDVNVGVADTKPE